MCEIFDIVVPDGCSLCDYFIKKCCYGCYIMGVDGVVAIKIIENFH